MRYFSKKRFTMRQVVGLLTGVFLGITVIAYAAVTVPNTFSSGTTISSAQVNANFTALGNAMPAAKTNGGNTSVLVSGTNIATDPTILNTFSATAPTDGVFLVYWSGYIYCAGSEIVENVLYVNSASTVLFNVEACAAVGEYRSVAAHYVQPATTGTSYAFEMRARDFNGAPNNMSVRDSRLTVLFVPSLLP